MKLIDIEKNTSIMFEKHPSLKKIILTGTLDAFTFFFLSKRKKKEIKKEEDE